PAPLRRPTLRRRCWPARGRPGRADSTLGSRQRSSTMTRTRRRPSTRPAVPTAHPSLEAKFRPRVEQLEQRWLPAADGILEWTAGMLRANVVDHSGGPGRPEEGGPVLPARAFAVVSAAAYDAFNSVQPTGAPYLVQVPGATTASADAAVAQAAHDTLSAL